MTRTLVAFAFAFTIAACDKADGETDEPTRVDDVMALTGNATDGQAVFDARCMNCHPADGTAGSGPSLSDAVPNLSEADIATIVIDGQGSMPSASDLEDQEIADVTAFLISEWN